MYKSLYFFLLVSAIIILGCKQSLDDKYLCRCLFFSTSDSDSCLFLEVYDNGLVNAYVGKPNSKIEKISDGFLINPDKDSIVYRIKEKKTIVLDASKLRQIQNMVGQIPSESRNYLLDNIFYDALGVGLYVGQRYFYFAWGDCENESIKALVKELKSLLPMPEIAHP